MSWYETAFGSKYLEVYSHRDDNEAERAMELIERVCCRDYPEADKLVLDLACGQGRYSRLLASRGHRVAALDLSEPLLLRGREALLADPPRPGEVWLVRGDMRSVPFGGVFDLAINMFTSFGYFTTDSENLRVLEQIASALRPGGRWVIDYLNRPRVIRTLVPEDASRSGELTVVQQRSIEDDGRRVVKRVRVSGPDGRHEWTESVRMYTRQQMERMLAKSGLETAEVFGDYDRSVHDEDSPRLILTGYKP